MAKRVPAPSWHLPQVLGRFFAFTMLLGSLEGRMLCTPWQLAQLATVCEPLLAARPWNEESKLTRRSLGMPNLRVRPTSPWQLPHVSRILLTFTGLAALVCFRILCSPWQSVHSGACVTPRASAVPCTLDRNCSTTSVWHMPQVSGRPVLAVHARPELLHHLGVAHAAGVGDRAAESLGFRRQQFVRPAVAQRAIRRALVARLAGLSVDAFIVVAGLIGVARDAGGFGNVGRMGNFFVRLVAGIAGQPRVRALRQLLTLLLVAGDALGRGGVTGGVKVSPGDAGKQAYQHRTEP